MKQKQKSTSTKNTIISKYTKITKNINNKNLKELKRSPIEFIKHTTGSREIRKILQQKPTHNINNITPIIKMMKEYNLTTKNRKDYIRNILSFWKNSILPANLSTLHLKIINHNLKLNAQAKHWIKNTNTKEENGRCTFFSLTRTTSARITHRCG